MKTTVESGFLKVITQKELFIAVVPVFVITASAIMACPGRKLLEIVPFKCVICKLTDTEVIEVKVAVTDMLPAIVNLAGLEEPDRAPLQPLKLQPTVGLAVNWTTFP
jgi:hypothetical protein